MKQKDGKKLGDDDGKGAVMVAAGGDAGPNSLRRCDSNERLVGGDSLNSGEVDI